MENTGEITLEEALRMLAAAKLQIEEQQQLLKSKENVILEKELKIDTQIAIINQKNIELETEKQEKEKLRIENLRLQEELSTHLAYRFCSHSERYDNHPSLFDFEDETLIPSETDLEASVAGEGPYTEEKVRAYIRRKCGRKAIDDSTPTKQVYHDISEEEKICACVCMLKKVGENSTKRLRIIPAKMYAIEDIYPKYGNIICRCESVTEGEIIDAIRRPLGAKSLDGVKRRTRAGMGRCQSGFCAPRTMEILARELGVDMSEITKAGGNSKIIVGINKDRL